MKHWCVSRGHKVNRLEITETRGGPHGHSDLPSSTTARPRHPLHMTQNPKVKCLSLSPACSDKIWFISATKDKSKEQIWLNIMSIKDGNIMNRWFHYESICIMFVQVEGATFWSFNDVCILLCLYVSSNYWVFRDWDNLIHTQHGCNNNLKVVQQFIRPFSDSDEIFTLETVMSWAVTC